MKEQIITSIDMGTSHVRIAVGQREEENPNNLQIIGLVEFPTQGINKGLITSIEDTVSSISSALEKVEKITGVSVEDVFVGISGNHITSQSGKGVVAVSKANGEIEEDDVQRAIESAQSVSSPPNREVLHIIPKSFIVDGQEAIKDPIGMTGIRLEAETIVIQGSNSQVKNLSKCIYRTGLNIEDMIYSGLGVAEAVLNNKKKELGVAVIDIGAATVNLTVFESGELIHSAVLPIGSDYITSDIALGLRIDLEMAEKIKMQEGYAVSADIDKKDEINLKDFGEESDLVISKKYLTKIIEARVEEIFEKINEELKKIDKAGMLPAGVILTGGGAKLRGIIEQAKKVLRLPARLGQVDKTTSVLDKFNDLSFFTAIGLVLWGNQMLGAPKSRGFNLKIIKDASQKFTKWLKNLRS